MTMAPTLFSMLLPVLLCFYSQRVLGGLVETVVCEDTECCKNCTTATVDLVNFGICRKKRRDYYYETHFCSENELYYVHNMYPSETCTGEPVFQYTSQRCYQWFDERVGKWVGYYLKCHHGRVVLNSNQQNTENDAENDEIEGYMHSIETVGIFLVFTFGIIAGYIIYKKQCCCKSKNMKESSEESQLLDCS